MLRYESFIEVEAPVELVFDMLADFEAYPSWMGGVRDVRRTGPRTTHWVAETALDVDVEWEAETTVFNPDRRIVWRAFRGDIHADGEAVLAQTERGATVIHYVLGYDTPAGRSGERATQFFGEHPLRRLERDLRRFKRLAERNAQRHGGRHGGDAFAAPAEDSGRGRDYRNAQHSDDRRRVAGPAEGRRGRAGRDGEDRGGWGYEEIQRREQRDRDAPDEGRRRDVREREHRHERDAREFGREGGGGGEHERGRGQHRRDQDEGREQDRPRYSLMDSRPRESGREDDDERGGEGRRGYESGWFERRGVDHLLDEPPSRRWRR